MQLSASWATILLLGLAVPAETPGEFQLVAFAQTAPEAHEWRPLAEKLAAASLAAQQAWLERGPLGAALAELGASDETHRAATEQQLGAARSQVKEGSPLSVEQFEELLVLRGKLEQAAIERLARAYRIATYNAFHGDRAEYDRRRQAWDSALSAWRLAGSRPNQRKILIAWLREAGESVGPLPATPRFAETPEVAARPAPQPSAVVTNPAPQPAVRPHAVLRPLAEPAPTSGPAGPRLDAQRRPARLAPARRTDLAEKAPPTAESPPKATPRRATIKPETPDPAPRVIMRRPAAPAPVVVDDEPPPARAAERARVARRPTTGAVPRSNPRISAPAVTADAARSSSSPTAGEAGILPPPRFAAPKAPQIGEIGPRPTQGPARELRIATVPDHEALATIDDTLVPGTGRPDEAVQINLSELSVRIGGYNFALAALESRLSDRHRWSADQLEPLVQQLHDLNQLRGMLDEYRAVARESDAAQVGRLEPLEPVVTAVASRISKARADTVNRASAEAGPREVAELERLEWLSERLASLVGGEQR